MDVIIHDRLDSIGGMRTVVSQPPKILIIYLWIALGVESSDSVKVFPKCVFFKFPTEPTLMYIHIN